MTAAGLLLRRVATPILDALLPPQCLNCRGLVERPGQLCATCWAKTTFITEPCCDCCGLPFAYDLGPGALCAACAREHPAFDHVRAVLRYDDASRPLLLGFKHGDRTDAAPAFGQWLARAGARLAAECDVIAPVPLHRWRLLKRRYNQSALLALRLGKLAGRPVMPDLLLRTRATPSQGSLSGAERRRNVRNAFAAASRHAALVRNRSILLVDDVFTTGATLEACARALKKAGARRVDAVVLARVVREGGATI